MENGNGVASYSRMEGRWVSIITGVSLAFGGWWLQNQYQATNAMKDQLVMFERAMDQKYVSREIHNITLERLKDLEEEFNSHRANMTRHSQKSEPGAEK